MATRKSVTLAVNGAEYLELEARAKEASLTIPAYVRTRCGLEPWLYRGRERERRLQPAQNAPPMAMDRIGVGLTVTSEEYGELQSQASAAALSVPQFIRTTCEFPVRWSSLPGTQEREREEDEAWERLKRLGLEPEEYFTEET